MRSLQKSVVIVVAVSGYVRFANEPVQRGTSSTVSAEDVRILHPWRPVLYVQDVRRVLARRAIKSTSKESAIKK